MKTGLDISLRICREEGYPVVTHYGKKLKPEKQYRVQIRERCFNRNYTRLDQEISYKELWEQFEKAGEGIKSYCDFANCPFPTPDEEPNFHNFVSLTQILFSYCGIE